MDSLDFWHTCYDPFCSMDIQMSEWPKKTVIYLHRDKESNWELGEELGLSEKAIREHFAYACYEVGIFVQVNEDGTVQALGIEGALFENGAKVNV
ncbi:hypothetical protein [Polynucleobacter sp.]|uniref:hypothetical protein n=1 Tax=Polynucleobacter sp. TaxID=2029855 RepID=UPI003F69F34B